MGKSGIVTRLPSKITEFCTVTTAGFPTSPNVAKRLERKTKVQCVSTSETSWIADDFAQEQDVRDLEVSRVPWRQGHLLRFEDKHGEMH